MTMRSMHKLILAAGAGAGAMYFLKPLVENIVSGVSGVVAGRPPETSRATPQHGHSHTAADNDDEE